MKKPNLQFKKWLYFVLLFTACGMTVYHIYVYLETKDLYYLFNASAMLLLAVGSFIEWRYIFKILK